MSEKNDQQDLVKRVESRNWADHSIVTTTVVFAVLATVAVPLIIFQFDEWATVPIVVLAVIFTAALGGLAVRFSRLVYHAQLLIRELVRWQSQSR